MKIQLITESERQQIERIYKENPVLTLQNKGYETPDKSKFGQDDIEAKKIVSDILNTHICGFSSFTNFRTSKDGRIEIRFQYNYNYNPADGLPFIGVGYIFLDELLNGF